jgi:ABC-type Fe3+-hydroxamate transport system substrate-binding protein
MESRPTGILTALSLFILFFCAACSSNTQPASNASNGSSSAPATSAAAASPSPADDNSKVCALFSAADAEKIMGAPMKLKSGRGKNVCMYEEVSARPNSIGTGTVALTLNQRQSADEENRAWANLKEVRHLQPGQKNVQVLNGVGDEAYFTGNIEKGKIGVSAVVARKGSSDFALDVMVLEYVGSPEALKATAKRIADKL